MASLLENTSRIANSAEDIKTSLLNKGAEFLEGEKIDTYSSKIDSLNVIQPGNYNVECYIRIDDVLVGEGITFNVVGTDGTTQTATSRAAGFIYLTLSYGVGYDVQPIDTQKYYANSHELIYHRKEDGSYFATDYFFYTAGSGGGNYQSKTITQNGTYLPDEGYDAFSDVTVNCEGSEDWEITDCNYLFYQGSRLDIIENLLKHIKNATNMNYMFNGCSKLTSLDLSSFNTGKVTNMYGVFSGCTSLASLDLSNFNTSNVTNMAYMFNACNMLASLNLSSFNTSNVTSMTYMFCNCMNLKSLDVSNFNTGKVTSMAYMFKGCSKLTSLDLSSFNTSNVTSMSYMFDGCSGLTSLDLSSFDTSKVTSMDYILRTSGNLNTVKGFTATGIKNGTLSPFGNYYRSSLKHFIFGGAFYSPNCNGEVTINLARLNGLEEGDENNGVIEMFNSLPENTTAYNHIIKIYTNVYNLLSDDTKAIATNKGYSITYGTS